MNNNKHNCNDCAIPEIIKHGLNLKNFNYLVALAGNPNVGKSTIFNALTGMRQHTGNWPGKTVSRAEGAFTYVKNKFKLVDLPGTYSLLTESRDEEIARNFLLFAKPDVTIIVVDAGKLERNLNLVLQILEITTKVVIALNLIDEAEKSGIFIKYKDLANELGIPVIPTIAPSKKGIFELAALVNDLAENNISTNPKKSTVISAQISDAIVLISNKLKELYPLLPNTNWLALRLLEGDEKITQSLINGSIKFNYELGAGS